MGISILFIFEYSEEQFGSITKINCMDNAPDLIEPIERQNSNKANSQCFFITSSAALHLSTFYMQLL